MWTVCSHVFCEEFAILFRRYVTFKRSEKGGWLDRFKLHLKEFFFSNQKMNTSYSKCHCEDTNVFNQIYIFNLCKICFLLLLEWYSHLTFLPFQRFSKSSIWNGWASWTNDSIVIRGSGILQKLALLCYLSPLI